MRHTIKFTRRHLPHWEVEAAEYFVTVRCADSLPRDAVLRLAELHQTLAGITPGSAEFAGIQRQHFRSLEKYLDVGHGSCPLREPECASIVIDELALLAEWHVAATHYTIMPNHWHALISPLPECGRSLSQIIKRLKGRSARRIRQQIGGCGPVWQREWFDRWMRDDHEREKTVHCIQQNPMRARLVDNRESHPWTK